MTQIKLKILTICLLWMFKALNAQEIWRESFPIPGKGIQGSASDTIYYDFTGINSWSLEYDKIELNDEGDYAKTVSTSGGRFEACDIDGEVIWRSEWIDISESGKVNIELTASETGSGANTQTKYLKAFYRLDYGEEFPFSLNGDNFGNWGSRKAVCNQVAGMTLQIVVYLSTHYAADKVILDEVVVSAEEKYFPPAQPGELLLNEILFNPFPGGEDYVEIYNNSNRDIPLGKLFLASRDKNFQLTQIYDLSGKVYLLPPNSYIAVTRDTNGIFPYFRIKCRECFQQVALIASFNNNADYVVLLNENLDILDEFHYNENMHTPFLADPEGVSLERISVAVPTNSRGNWYSAAGEAGYGTPGYQNSIADNGTLGKPIISFEPKAFSPNYDGYNDECIIHYQLSKPGYVTNIKIFDANGRFIHHYLKNETLGTSGKLIWNGQDETGKLLPVGIYVVMMELFNSEGEIYRFKEGVVLTGKMD